MRRSAFILSLDCHFISWSSSLPKFDFFVKCESFWEKFWVDKVKIESSAYTTCFLGVFMLLTIHPACTTDTCSQAGWAPKGQAAESQLLIWHPRTLAIHGLLVGSWKRGTVCYAQPLPNCAKARRELRSVPLATAPLQALHRKCAPLLPLVPSQNSARHCRSPADNRVITPADNQGKGKCGGGFIFSWTSNLSPIQPIKWPDRHEHWQAYCFSQLHSKRLAPPGKSHTSRRAGLPRVWPSFAVHTWRFSGRSTHGKV